MSPHWWDSSFCTSTNPIPSGCVLWGISYELLTLALVSFFFAVFAHYVMYLIYALMLYMTRKYGKAFWGEQIRILTSFWTTWLLRTGLFWLGWSLLELPTDVWNVLKYIIPLPFLIVLFLCVNSILDAISSIGVMEFTLRINNHDTMPSSSTISNNNLGVSSSTIVSPAVAATTVNDDVHHRDDNATTTNKELDPAKIRVANTRITVWTEGIRITKYIAFIALFVIDLEILTVDVVGFLSQGGGTLLGLIIVFATQPWIRNLVGGIVVFADDKFVLGDVVRAAGVEGRVERITLRTTTLIRGDNAICTIPNARMMEQPIVNCSMRKKKLIKITVPLDPSCDTDAIRNLLRDLESSLRTFHPDLIGNLSNEGGGGSIHNHNHNVGGGSGDTPFVVALDGVFDLVVKSWLRWDASSPSDDSRTVELFESEIMMLVASSMAKTGVKANVDDQHLTNNRLWGTSTTDASIRPVMTEEDNDVSMISTAYFVY